MSMMHVTACSMLKDDRRREVRSAGCANEMREARMVVLSLAVSAVLFASGAALSAFAVLS